MNGQANHLSAEATELYSYFNHENKPDTAKNWGWLELQDIPETDPHNFGEKAFIIERVGSNDCIEIWLNDKTNEDDDAYQIQWTCDGLVMPVSYDSKKVVAAVSGIMTYMINNVVRRREVEKHKKKITELEKVMERRTEKIQQLGSELESYKEAWELLPIRLSPEEIRNSKLSGKE